MKRFFYLFLLLPLVGCSKEKTESFIEEDSIVSHDYSEIENRIIKWPKILSQEDKFYYGYIFSKTCGHCQEIKDKVIDYAIRKNNIYFVEFDNSIPIVGEINSTINATYYEDIGILGTPTLLQIFDHTLIANVAGSKNILSLLENQ